MTKRDQETLGCSLLILCVGGFFGYFIVASYIGYLWTTAGLIALLVMGIAIALAAHRQSQLQSTDAQNLSARLNNVSSLSGAQFEQLVADIFRAQGFSVTMLGGSGDQGVDLIAKGTDGKAAIQCKNYAKAVGNAPVQEVYSGSRYHNCDEAWVVAPRGYTRGAHDLAERVNVALLDTASLREMIQQIDISQRNEVA